MSNFDLKELRKKRKLNTEWLKKHKGFEHHSNEEAELIINQLKRLAYIVCRHIQKTGK